MNLKKCGSFIQRKREDLNMTPADLGSRLSVSEERVTLWESGQVCPTVGQMAKLSLLLGCTVTELANGADYDFNRPVGDQAEDFEVSTPPEEYHKDVTVTLDYDSDRAVSPLLFGDNLEHTRGCVCGGISAEMLFNRKFVSLPDRFGCAHGWYAIGSEGFFALNNAAYSPGGFPSYTRHHEDHRIPRRDECNCQLITNFHSATSGIGQKDLLFSADTDYECTLAATAVSEIVVTVSLMGGDSTVYDRKEISVHAGDYREYGVTLHTPRADAEGRLEITFEDEGTLVLGAVSLMPAGHFRGMRRDVIEKMKDLGITILRWPGGNFAGDYNWKDGLLPRNMRAPYQSSLWLHTQPHTMGYDFHELNTDDFIALCREIGAEPYITVNPAWSTPEESAQWVEYCNGDETTPYGRLRMERGHWEPYNVRFWSLGNEAGHGHMEGPNIPTQYAKVVREHALQMLRVSPHLTFFSSGSYPNMDWVRDCAIPLSDLSSLISVHHYVLFPNFSDPAKRRDAYYHLVGSGYGEFLYKIRETRKQLGDSPVQIAFDEWNAYHAWFRRGGVSEGIMTASILHMLFRCAHPMGIALACHFESVNEGALQVFSDRVVLSPTGRALALMKEHAGGTVCVLEEDLVATRKEGAVTCTLLNRSYDKEKRFTLQNCGKPISALLYASEDVVPNTVFEERALDITWQDGCAETVLPPHSMALLRMELCGDGQE